MLYKYVGHEDPNELIKILKFFIEDGTIRATRHTTSMTLPNSKPNLVLTPRYRRSVFDTMKCGQAKATMTVRTG